ncbi:hypothetical protein BDZ91DRAFT_734627 [Kalaharituber pfeilii]|nr:hypothetical protein BDZ91DRAFT_734627 [Kalaharituber pfeilii]
MSTRNLTSHLVDNFEDEIHHPWGNNSQHLTSCPAANDALQDLLQSTLYLATEPFPVRFGDLFQGLGLALQVLCDGPPQSTTKRIPNLFCQRCLADLLEEDLNKFVNNTTSLNVVTAVQCNIIIITILFWQISKAAEESLILRVSELHNIVLILWDLRDVVIIDWGSRVHCRLWCCSRSCSCLAFGKSRVCNLDITGVELSCWDDQGVDSNGRESKSEEGSGELHFEYALDSKLGLGGEVGSKEGIKSRCSK